MSETSRETKFLVDLADECERSGTEFGKGRAFGILETLRALEAAAKVRQKGERVDVVLHTNNTIGVERADMRFSRIKNGLPVFEGQAIEVNLKKGDSVVIRPIGGKDLTSMAAGGGEAKA